MTPPDFTPPDFTPTMQDYFLLKAAATLRADGHYPLARVVDLIREQVVAPIPEPDRDDTHTMGHA